VKPGLEIGSVKTITVETTQAMRAGFDLGDDFLDVHPLYGTAPMVSHMEWAARQHLLPVLEDHEEGVGLEVQLTHLKPVQLGKTVRVEAKLTDYTEKRLGCDVTVYCDERLVGQGRVIQAVVNKAEFAKNYVIASPVE
jgi:fluoroacetyl-CoA thioesterase